MQESEILHATVQVHEWGGVFTDIVTYSHFRQFRPGLRIAINSHGGHYWSTQVYQSLPYPYLSGDCFWCWLTCLLHPYIGRPE